MLWFVSSFLLRPLVENFVRLFVHSFVCLGFTLSVSAGIRFLVFVSSIRWGLRVFVRPFVLLCGLHFVCLCFGSFPCLCFVSWFFVSLILSPVRSSVLTVSLYSDACNLVLSVYFHALVGRWLSNHNSWPVWASHSTKDFQSKKSTKQLLHE